VLQQVVLPVVITDARGVIRYANDGASRLLGEPVARLLRRSFLDLAVPEDRVVVGRHLTRTAAHQPSSDRLVRLVRGADGGAPGVVPCVVGAVAAVAEDLEASARRIVWTMVRAGEWPVEAGPTGMTTLAVALNQIALLPTQRTAPAQLVQRMVSWCRLVTGERSGIGLVLWDRGAEELIASTSQAVQSWGQAQLEAQQGPLVAAARETAVVSTRDLGRDPSYPALADAVPAGHTAVSCPMLRGDTVVGVLTAYDVDAYLLASQDVVMPSLAAAATAMSLELQALQR
jgi:hypothetical protein